MAWHIVLLPDVASFRGQFLNSVQHFLLHALHVYLCVESEAIWENEHRYNITMAIELLKYYDVDLGVCFYILY